MYVLIPPMTQGWVAHLCGRAGGSPGVGEGGPQECWLSSWGAAVRAMTTPWPCSSGVVASTGSWHPSGPSTTHPAIQMGDPWMPMAASCSTQGPPRSKGRPGTLGTQGPPRLQNHPASKGTQGAPGHPSSKGNLRTPQHPGSPSAPQHTVALDALQRWPAGGLLGRGEWGHAPTQGQLRV